MRAVPLLLLLLVAGCASDPAPEPGDVPFARRLLAREAAGIAPRAASADEPVVAHVFPATPAPSDADVLEGLIDPGAAPMQALRVTARDPGAVIRRLASPVSRHELAVLAWFRSPAVAAAREHYAATRTSYQQAQDLSDLVRTYRSFARDSKAGVGPNVVQRPAERIAPYPNVDALAGELARRAERIAFEDLRVAARDAIAAAWIAHADAVHLERSLGIVAAELELDERLLVALRARLEAGRGSQAGLLALTSRVERLRTEWSVLDARRAVIVARWAALLDLPADTAIAVQAADDGEPPVVAPEFARAQAEAAAAAPEVRRAELRTERQALALRMAETMTLPAVDVGSSRFERERVGDAGAARGAVFPAPGRGLMTRADFGVREAQVVEMRARLAAVRSAEAGVRNATAVAVRAAVFDLDAALRRASTLSTHVIPNAEGALDVVRGAYEADRAGYVEVLDALRALLDARQGRADASRAARLGEAALLRAVGRALPLWRNR